MTHLWLRTEERPNEARAGLTPEGAATLLATGFQVTVEDSPDRAIATGSYRSAGCKIAPAGSWRDAPEDAIIFGLKELAPETSPLSHRHIMFAHAYKGQTAGRALLERLRAGGGTLYDLEYLLDAAGRRVAAFGYWAGFAGAAVAIKCWCAPKRGQTMMPLSVYSASQTMGTDVRHALRDAGAAPTALIIGALGRVGSGARDLCGQVGVATTDWDIEQTAHGGPYPEILRHDIFLSCILAGTNTPVFIDEDAKYGPRKLSVIGDIACDPESDFSPIKVYDRVTSWNRPMRRVHQRPPLDVTAIDNLPSLLPVEASQDFAGQLLPSLLALPQIDQGVWGRAGKIYADHRNAL